MPVTADILVPTSPTVQPGSIYTGTVIDETANFTTEWQPSSYTFTNSNIVYTNASITQGGTRWSYTNATATATGSSGTYIFGNYHVRGGTRYANWPMVQLEPRAVLEHVSRHGTVLEYIGPRTPEQEAAHRKDRLKARLRRARIDRTADAMLKTLCTPEQWRSWVAQKSIRIEGKRGIFEINPGWQGEIFLLDAKTREPMEKLCYHAKHDYPTADRAASLLLAIQADEDKVYAGANRHAFLTHEKERFKLGRIRLATAALN